ncbi:MAG: ATP-binding protein [Sediminibacterium sp.]|nr:ATP-binding protein [Sediminibacterium sp.]MBW0165005.1 ATP-binding protein [Sediminibacterium sp.]
MAIQGASGSGKTYSALSLAYGLCGDWTKIAVIDTENHSSELYAHLGNYQVLHVEAPFSPERYIEAIQVCEKADIEVIIIDSISHEWEGIGGILATHSNMTGNSYTNWSKLTPRHNAFVQHMLQSPLHIIGTIRAKQEYILSEKNGKQVPEKVGMKGVTREGMDYEFTLVFNLDMRNQATATKDRTSVFTGQPEFRITQETGKKILQWCNEGEKTEQGGEGDLYQRINDCKSLDELLQLYYSDPNPKPKIKSAFTKRKAELQKTPVPTS